MAKAIHPDFVSLSEICPDIRIEASYASAQNFTGEIVRGYKARAAFLARMPARALCSAQKAALERGLSLKIFDGYRPLKAVTFFQEWAQRPETNPRIKEHYYPTFSRKELFDQGYIAKQSSHSRGSAVDLTLVSLKTEKELDMGSAFDYFDTISNTESPKITSAHKENRRLLKEIMIGHGFKNYPQEWWHYSYQAEPFPNEYFDFDVE